MQDGRKRANVQVYNEKEISAAAGQGRVTMDYAVADLGAWEW